MNAAGLRASRVLVVGDVMLDRYYAGEVDRVSPEAPVPVVRVRTQHECLGGAANVANNVAHLGSAAVLLGVVGEDADGARLAALCRDSGIAAELLPARRPTTAKIRVLGGHHQVARLDFEADAALEAPVQARLAERITRHVPQVDVVLVSDYGKGVCAPEVRRHAVQTARAAGKRVVVAPKGLSWEGYERATVLVPNVKELGDVLGRRLGNDDSVLDQAGREARERFELDAVLVTRGERGMTLVEPRAVVHLPTLAKTLFDVTGAGDTVAAAFALALASDRSFHDAARLANHAGGLAVGKPRTAPVSLAELAADLPPWPEAKSVTRAELVGHLERLRADGRRIVFTNGCFDLLHRGHVSLLARAKELGDVLVVGVNTDASVRRLKGAPRPLTREDDRVAVLAAVGCVDFVVLFDEETPYELIQAVAPDVLVKGGDYRPDEVVGRDLVPRTVVMPLVEGYSTTGIVGRLAAPP